MELEFEEYDRRTFTVKAIEVTYKNIEALAEKCGGKLDVETSRVLNGAGEVELPVIKLQGFGENKGSLVTARLGYFVVENRGRFSVYKPPQFQAAFEKKGALNEVEKQFAEALQEHENGFEATRGEHPLHDNSSIDGQETVHVSL